MKTIIGAVHTANARSVWLRCPSALKMMWIAHDAGIRMAMTQAPLSPVIHSAPALSIQSAMSERCPIWKGVRALASPAFLRKPNTTMLASSVTAGTSQSAAHMNPK